jgi:hypothetical protein
MQFLVFSNIMDFMTENKKMLISGLRTCTQRFIAENEVVFFLSGELVPKILWLKMAKFFSHERTRTEEFVTKNYKVFP